MKKSIAIATVSLILCSASAFAASTGSLSDTIRTNSGTIDANADAKRATAVAAGISHGGAPVSKM